jgi:lysophospholipase L1-like esterase
MRMPSRGALVALAAALVLGACSSGASPDEPGPGPASTSAPTASSSPAAPAALPTTYVALGDSFVAGPGIDPQQPGSGYCGRSAENWPTQLAERLSVDDVTDLSCSGATSADVRATIAASPLDEDTALVTLGVGGNDGSLFTTLISRCATDGPACAAYTSPDQLGAVLEGTIDDVVATVAAVRQRAPRARILLTGYLRIMPARGTCAAVGVPAGQADRVAGAERALEIALSEAADEAGVDFVSVRDASEGHDACAGGQAWTNGQAPVTGDGIFFHPNRRGMAGVATTVEDVVRG